LGVVRLVTRGTPAVERDMREAGVSQGSGDM